MYCAKCGKEVRTIITSTESGVELKLYKARCFDCHVVLQSWTDKL